MELVVLFVIAALLLFGPRRGGGRPGPLGMAVGTFFLLWMLVMFAVGTAWSAIFGYVSQP